MKNLENPKLNGNVKKLNVNINGKKDIIGNTMSLYLKNIKLLHIVFLVISVVVFIGYFFVKFYQLKTGSYVIDEGFTVKGVPTLITDCVLLSGVIVIAGVTPYCYLSVLGLFQSALLVEQLAARYYYGRGFIITDFVGGLIEMIGVALCIATGIYSCKLSTKKSKYKDTPYFSMDDLKSSIYEIKKDTKKVEEIEKKKQEKIQKMQQYKVEVPYLSIIVLCVVGAVFQFVGTLIVAL